jgi:hypothetical protein
MIIVGQKETGVWVRRAESAIAGTLVAWFVTGFRVPISEQDFLGNLYQPSILTVAVEGYIVPTVAYGQHDGLVVTARPEPAASACSTSVTSGHWGRAGNRAGLADLEQQATDLSTLV